MNDLFNTLDTYENGSDEQINNTVSKAIQQNKKAFVAWLCKETFDSQLIGEVPENQFVIDFEQNKNLYELGMMLEDGKLKYDYIMPFVKKTNGYYYDTDTFYSEEQASQYYGSIIHQFFNWLNTKPNIDNVIAKYHDFHKNPEEEW